jgi:hypothetical protein
MNKFNAGNPKSVWYYTTGVNVHVAFILTLFRSVLFASRTFSCCAALGQVSRPSVFLLLMLTVELLVELR